MDITFEELQLLERLIPFIPLDKSFSVYQVTADAGITILTEQMEGSLLEINENWEFQPREFNIQSIERFLINIELANLKIPQNLFHRNDELLLSETGKKLIESGSWEKYTMDIIQETNQLRRLDWILEFMAKNANGYLNMWYCWKEIKKLHPTIHKEGKESYVYQLFDKLSNEKYLIKGEGVYRITLNGLILIENGGYEEANKKNIATENNKNQKETLLTIGSWIAGIGTILLFLTEIAKHFHMRYLGYFLAIQFWVFVFVFLFGIIAGIIIYMLILEVMKQRKMNLTQSSLD